jgi:hypothetical protein
LATLPHTQDYAALFGCSSRQKKEVPSSPDSFLYISGHLSSIRQRIDRASGMKAAIERDINTRVAEHLCTELRIDHDIVSGDKSNFASLSHTYSFIEVHNLTFITTVNEQKNSHA